MTNQKLVPHLWFNQEAKEAIKKKLITTGKSFPPIQRQNNVVG
ncbi:hypothetical protein ACTWP4_05045 [Gracilibacillus sp. D59]